jgi:hypothetical protein
MLEDIHMKDGGSKARPVDAEIQGFFCPLQRPSLLELRLRSGKCVYTDAGLEKMCAKCNCFWPMDTEFWFPRKTEDGLFGWCRACYIAQRWPLRGAPVHETNSPLLADLLALVTNSPPEARA